MHVLNGLSALGLFLFVGGFQMATVLSGLHLGIEFTHSLLDPFGCYCLDVEPCENNGCWRAHDFVWVLGFLLS